MPGASKTAKYFFDTNVLVYSFDFSEPAKQQLAEKILKNHLHSKNAMISIQVVQEFLNVALNKFKNIIPYVEIPDLMEDLLQPLCANHVPNFEFFKRGMELKTQNSLSFYDALIIQAAIDLDCRFLYSEDLQDGQIFGKLRIVNPFKP